MSITSTLAAGRRAAESRMTSRALVRRVDPDNPGTDENGFEVDGWATVYDGPFRLSGSTRGDAGSRTARVGDVDVELAVRVAHFPASTTGLRDGDVIEVTSGDTAGIFLRIIEADWQDQATARRVPVLSVSRPAGWL